MPGNVFSMQALKALAPVFLAALVLGSSAGAAEASASAKPRVRVDLPYSMVVREIGNDKYQVEVQNTNPTIFIKDFTWSPPNGLTVKAVNSTEGGNCSLNGNGGINCSGKVLPPTCVGSCIGASLIVTFTATGKEPVFANGYWTHFGVVGALNITGTIPVKQSSFADLPYCRKGQKSTKSQPCVPAT
jgi:hypothetical protein